MMAGKINERLVLDGFNDFVMMRDRETDHFNYLNKYADNGDKEQVITGKFILNMKEIQKLLNNEYLNEIEFSDDDKARFDFIISLYINKESIFDLDQHVIMHNSSILLDDEDSYIVHLIEDILELNDSRDKIEKLFYKKFKKEQPIEIEFMSEDDDRSTSKIMKMIKRYNERKSNKIH